jgi:glyoxylase-like metal-dependent hydrolase (beta-lactamase superfamily II)
MKVLLHLLFFLALLTPQWSMAQEIYSNDHVEVIKLSEQAFLLRENFDFAANCVLIEGEKGLLLIDTGFEELGEYLIDAIHSFGKEVSVIVNSHGHNDHVGGNYLFSKNVLFIGHENCQELYGQSGHRVQTIEKNPTFDFEGNLVFFLPYTGGHSECDILTFIPGLNLAFLGDLYLSESFPLVLIESGSSVETLLFHLNEIFQSLPDNTLMIPGHGKTTNMEYFGGYIALVEKTIELVRIKMNSGWSLQEILDADVLTDYERWGQYFPFITKETWIEQIYLSYID